MLGALRDWTANPRSRKRIGDLAIEFVIVLFGVFAAQALANWVAERGAYAEMERAKTRADREIASDLYATLVWKAALPCFRGRVVRVMRDASRGDVRAEFVQRPMMKTLYFTPISDQSELLMRARYGDTHAHLYAMIQSNADSLGNRAGRMMTAWGRMMVASPGTGMVSEGDRVVARQAAADILSELRGIEIVADNIIEYAGKLGIEADWTEKPGYGPARTCAAIWKSGRSDPPLGMR